ncbi:MAG: M20/M25/M40 family metallo-hydrolase [Actinomycetota bacterium]|nr:M20/M25/M40 family metallo-hydrolase [Actinomycetota bacterium]
MNRPTHRTIRAGLLLALLLAGIAVVAVGLFTQAETPSKGSPGEEARSAPSSTGASARLRSAVTVRGLMEHERRFQAIADEHGGNRAAGTSGYDASAAYVARELREAGYEVTVQPFELPFFEEVEPARLERRDQAVSGYTRGVDFALMEYSGSGDATGRVRPVDAGPDASTSGCEAKDFAQFPEGSIALLRRGECSFRRKAGNAEEGGALAALIFNDGGPRRTGVLRGTLGGPGVGIPVLGTTSEVGEELLAAARNKGAEVHIAVRTVSRTRETSNVIAELSGGEDGRTLVVGAHLDSVPQGPGINDNGSGSATVLEIALQMSRLGIEPKNRVRFALWGAEELGLLGSRHYVAGLTEDEISEISAYLNFDMVGSPNFVRSVYEGPDATEEVFTDYFDSRNIGVEVDSSLDGRSDHGPFAAEGIPTGGLFSGAEGIKTRREAASFGGEAGAAHDPCYHRACDDLDNLNEKVLNQFSDAAAHATISLANRPPR